MTSVARLVQSCVGEARALDRRRAGLGEDDGRAAHRPSPRPSPLQRRCPHLGAPRPRARRRQRGRASLLPKTRLVIAKGTALPASGALHAARAVWLIPTPEFQRAQLAAPARRAGPRSCTRCSSCGGSGRPPALATPRGQATGEGGGGAARARGRPAAGGSATVGAFGTDAVLKAPIKPTGALEDDVGQRRRCQRPFPRCLTARSRTRTRSFAPS
jgi:hypothetical protein